MSKINFFKLKFLKIDLFYFYIKAYVKNRSK